MRFSHIITVGVDMVNWEEIGPTVLEPFPSVLIVTGVHHFILMLQLKT